MIEYKKLFIFVVLLYISLFLTWTPYINHFFTEKIWVFYLFLLLYLFPPKNIIYVLYLTCIFFLALIISTLLGFNVLAEMIGVVVFVLLCIIFSIRFYRLIKEA